MEEKKSMTCVVCPMGCSINVTFNDREVLSVEGNSCNRGYEYAKAEITNPSRVLTTTIRLVGGNIPLLPLKSSKPIPKALLIECMKAVNSRKAFAPVGIGDVIISDIMGTGIDMVSTRPAEVLTRLAENAV